MSVLDRRTFMAVTGAMFVVPHGVSGQRPRFDHYPFSLGVASGDPVPDGVILWTRLAPEPLVGSGMPPGVSVAVQWEVAADEAFRRVVRRGTVTARADAAHTVHVDVRGLESDRWYWYRFRTYGSGGPVDSPTGRTRTAPRPDAAIDEFRFAFASCQRYEDGYYTAHRHMSDEDLRMVLFLGDYVYESVAEPATPRHHGLDEAQTLDDYRRRYALYRSDADLQRAHQSFPWLIVWDDHELLNDFAGQAARRDPRLAARRRAAYQAFAEHMPIRARLARGGDSLQMYRRLAVGRLANICLLDTRQYRSLPACDGGLQDGCADARDPRRTMLGSRQEAWLFDSLRRSPARWQIVAQQVPFATVDREPGPGVSLHMDKWDGYHASRERILDLLAARGRHDTVVLTGDNHNSWLMELRRRTDAESAEPIANEFVGTSISSTGDGADQRDPYACVLSDNPHARYLNSRRGYVRCTVTAREWHTDFRVVPYVSTPDAPVSTDATFVLQHGTARAERG